MTDLQSLDTLVSLAKRRGYVFQSSEIYGGTGSVWDYGPLGIELKLNVKNAWWDALVRQLLDDLVRPDRVVHVAAPTHQVHGVRQDLVGRAELGPRGTDSHELRRGDSSTASGSGRAYARDSGRDRHPRR